MEAPKKIQVHLIKNDDHWSIKGYSFLEDKQFGMTEYTRTDVFIEKLEKWLKEHILDYVRELNYGVGKSQPDYYTKHFIEDVKKYMKGE